MFHGSIVALVTPMKINGELDYEALDTLLEMHIVNGTHAIVILGTTGESPTIEPHEREVIIHRAVKYIAERIPVIVGTGTNSTKKTIELTTKAMEAGADACLLVTPYYNRPTQEGLFQHYQAVAEAVPIPQILYNVPSRTGCDLLPGTVARLAEISNIVGIKEGNPQRADEIIQQCGDQLDVYSADDATGLEIMRKGGKGVISVVANIAPRMLRELCEAVLSDDHNRAESINVKLAPLCNAMFIETNPIPIKWALREMQLIGPGIRLPLTPLAERYHEVVRTALYDAGVLAPHRIEQS